MGNLDPIIGERLEFDPELSADQLHRLLGTSWPRSHRELRGRAQVLQQLVDEHGDRRSAFAILQERVEMPQRVQLAGLASYRTSIGNDHIRELVDAEHRQQLGRSCGIRLVSVKHLAAQRLYVLQILAAQAATEPHEILDPAVQRRVP